MRCPIGAHVRRANPRNTDYPGRPTGLARLIADLGFGRKVFREDLTSAVRFHRILRRGREYGPGLSPRDAVALDPPDARERGLHFICLNANIGRQFEFLQNAWMSSLKFSGLSQESDPLVGNREPVAGLPVQPTPSRSRARAARRASSRACRASSTCGAAPTSSCRACGRCDTSPERRRSARMRASRRGRPALLASVGLASCGLPSDARSPTDCLKLLQGGFRPIAVERNTRFLGKVEEATAGCRGGERAVRYRATPWVDWSNYWGTGDARSRGRRGTSEDRRGIEGALLDLEYQRLELIAFNLLDNGGTYAAYVKGRGSLPGPSLEVWPELRLAPTQDPATPRSGAPASSAAAARSPATGRSRESATTSPIPRWARPASASLVSWSSRPPSPSSAQDELARNRHGDRIGLLQPDPQRISRALLSREAEDDYQKADTLNVLAAFWIQFQTHDWFSHLEEGRNAPGLMPTGCEAKSADCRPDDRIDRCALRRRRTRRRFDDRRARPPGARPPDEPQHRHRLVGRVAALRLRRAFARSREARSAATRRSCCSCPPPGDPRGYLPLLGARDPMNPAWAGQEATAFPDNWNVGLSFFHNVFAREHNAFVDAFRAQADGSPEADCGLRDPDRPGAVVRYRDVTAEQLFEVARLVVAAEIAKIHTIEWTTQLLYDEPLYLALHANWDGLFEREPARLARARRSS